MKWYTRSTSCAIMLKHELKLKLSVCSLSASVWKQISFFVFRFFTSLFSKFYAVCFVDTWPATATHWATTISVWDWVESRVNCAHWSTRCILKAFDSSNHFRFCIYYVTQFTMILQYNIMAHNGTSAHTLTNTNTTPHHTAPDQFNGILIMKMISHTHACNYGAISCSIRSDSFVSRVVRREERGV